MDSCLAAWIKPQVLTSTTLASSAEVRSQPDAVSRAASSSESTSLRAQPSVTRLTVRGADAGDGRDGTRRAYATRTRWGAGLAACLADPRSCLSRYRTNVSHPRCDGTAND